MKKTKIYNFFRILYYICIEIYFQIYKYFRIFISNSKYEKLSSLHNKYEGERCFIVATGPSLTIKDLEKIKHEYCFGMNSVVKLFDRTEWRPTFYGCQDPRVYRQLKYDIDNSHFEYKFYGSFLKMYFKLTDEYVEFPIDLMNHPYNFKKYTTKFSDNCDIVVYDGFSITYSLMQIAVYMGFKEIYLLGTDCDYSGERMHVVEYKDKYISGKDSITNRLLYAFSVAADFAHSHDVKIYNATRGGKLEIFERINLDDLILKESKRNIEE